MMKRVKKILLFFALCILFFLFSCSKEEKSIELPNPHDVELMHISMTHSSLSRAFNTHERISEVIEGILKEAVYRGESVNDTPTNIEDYLTVVFSYKDEEKGTETIYLFEKNGDYFVEKPYSGVWEIPEKLYTKLKDMI